ncbi:MAG: sterol carrier family protein [Actinomycetaceae bacterium]|nr:sterol carrier family protein [Actinomycetaceae bacterium]
MAKQNLHADGQAALQQWQADKQNCPRPVLAAAVRWTLAVLAQQAPGHAVEVRVPPWAAVQILGGTTHRRGTPPAVIEMRPTTWLELATGELQWGEAVANGLVDASGQRTDLQGLLPLAGI